MAEQRDNSAQSDSMERLLKSAMEAEAAGVFAATPIDAGSLLRESSQVPVPLALTIGRKWMPVAAVIGLAAVVWSTMFYVKLSDLGEQSRLVSQSIRENAASPAHISLCVGGPVPGDATECADRQYDFDTDGDIDLADFSRFQLAFAQ